MDKRHLTFSDYMADDTKVSSAEREKINFAVDLIGKMIEAREKKGLTQQELAEISGVKQPAIARLESLKATPQIDTLFKILNPLGYTLTITPIVQDKAHPQIERPTTEGN